jgi:hypothetical protein
LGDFCAAEAGDVGVRKLLSRSLAMLEVGFSRSAGGVVGCEDSGPPPGAGGSASEGERCGDSAGGGMLVPSVRLMWTGCIDRLVGTLVPRSVNHGSYGDGEEVAFAVFRVCGRHVCCACTMAMFVMIGSTPAVCNFCGLHDVNGVLSTGMASRVAGGDEKRLPVERQCPPSLITR